VSVLSVARIYDLTMPSETNKRCPIIGILSLISIEMVFNSISKVRLLGNCNSDNP
jgi:hypothetical protein